MKFKKGFSMIEVLLVVGIAAIIFLFSAPYTLNFYKTQLVEEARSNIMDALRRARHNAVLQKNDSKFGVHFDAEADTYTLFQGDSYLDRTDVYDEVYTLIPDINVTGITDVVFSKLTGSPDTTGTTTVTYGSISRGIALNDSGILSKVITEAPAEASPEAEFSPTDITGLSVWLDLSIRNDSDGTVVTSVSDLSGNSRNFTGEATIETNILNGLPVARVNDSQTLGNATDFGRPITVFYVARQNDTAGGRLLSGLSNNWLLGHWTGYKNMFYAEGWVSASEGVEKDTDWHIWVGRQTEEISSMWDGLTPIDVTNPTAGTDGPNGLVFTGYLGGSELSNADLAELVVYDSALSDDNVAVVTNYLKTKYGL